MGSRGDLHTDLRSGSTERSLAEMFLTPAEAEGAVRGRGCTGLRRDVGRRRARA